MNGQGKHEGGLVFLRLDAEHSQLVSGWAAGRSSEMAIWSLFVDKFELKLKWTRCRLTETTLRPTSLSLIHTMTITGLNTSSTHIGLSYMLNKTMRSEILLTWGQNKSPCRMLFQNSKIHSKIYYFYLHISWDENDSLHDI